MGAPFPVFGRDELYLTEGGKEIEAMPGPALRQTDWFSEKRQCDR